jgi:glycosyltransferase involved in cell wall biosynthesis
MALIIFAPSIHSGGGLVLLDAILSIPKLLVKLAILDYRALQKLALPNETLKRFVQNTFFSRLYAEWHLWRSADTHDLVLCFHGLPPLFPSRGRVICYLQNRILVSRYNIVSYPARIKYRLLFERWLLRAFSSHVDHFFVQTPSMARDAVASISSGIDISVLPFIANPNFIPSKSTVKYFDFIYVASDEPHKNHENLLYAWVLLAEEGHKPTLALTVPTDSMLSKRISELTNQYELSIFNLGYLPASELSKLYSCSSALIYPSTTESFGLPLIEAKYHGLPILASELDYVRDVATPVQTFDPDSSLSIARAVKRFLGIYEPIITPLSPEEFLNELIK